MDNTIKDSMAEKAVLGALLLDNSKMDNSDLSMSDFYHENNKVIFSVISEQYNRGENFDLITIQNALSEKGKLDSIGGLKYLFDIQENAAKIDAIFREHLGIVKKKAGLRIIEMYAKEAIALCRGEADPEEVLAKLSEISLVGGTCEVENIFNVFKENHSELERKLNGECFGIPTGYIDLDRMLGGLQKADLILLAARPSMGKTALAINITVNIAVKNDGWVLVFSLEMSSGQLINRVISSVAEIPSQHLKNPQEMTDQDWQSYWEASRLVEGKHLDIYDNGYVTPAKIRKIAKQYKSRGGLDLIVIDYLQLMHSNKETGNKAVDVGDITRDLKLIARELNVPVILLSQLNRGCEARENKRPMMSDLRDSGSIEQDADVAMFLYREGYYNKEFEFPKMSELIIRKHRNGPTGTVFLTFEDEYTCFKNASHRVDGI